MSIQPVLIVGAGITGLTTALALAHNRINFRLIDKKDGPDRGTRGPGVWQRSLEMHNLLGTLPDILKTGVPFNRFKIHSFMPATAREPVAVVPGIPYKEPTPDIPWANAMWIWQSLHEDILRVHLKQLGVEVEWGTELKTVESLEAHVNVQLLHDGKEEHLRTDYLVSAEGARSAVRKTLGFTFLGETKPQKWVIGDIELLEGLDRSSPAFYAFGDASDILIQLCPSPHAGYNYVQIIVAGRNVPFERMSSGREGFVEEFYKLTERTDIKFGEVLWLSLYSLNIRMVDTFSKGRCFLAGDAAHVHAPTGGQGLNSGLQDGMNLGWKLASVLKNESPPSLLQSYNEERLPVIATMLDKTSALYKTEHAESAPRKVNRGDPALMMLGINYRTSSFVFDSIHPGLKPGEENAYVPTHEGLWAGDRAPNAPGLVRSEGSLTMLFDIFKPTHHTALIFAPTVGAAKSRLDIIKDQNGRIISFVVLPKGSQVDDAKVDGAQVIVDSEGHAKAAYLEKNGFGEDGIFAYLVRPDSYIGALAGGDGRGLREYITKIFV